MVSEMTILLLKRERPKRPSAGLINTVPGAAADRGGMSQADFIASAPAGCAGFGSIRNRCEAGRVPRVTG